ncbi:beta-ketoacyl-[acyl-carrier-protein] synthase family protein [Streptococcus equinus]|uniref:beta-ketoacyl-[acyl-carrier-protein] synthase family protein n=1 Tax=Streptococcus equinus TaxID=1335 RepID=UPI0005F82384|nr:beta-ketoacyl-[acyl-carrier-protein] synthase family protein [Streptococcus equinus]
MQRVVVTGLGTVNPIGLSNDETWKRVLQGKKNFSYYEPIGVVLSRVNDAFNASLSKKDIRYQDRVTQLAVVSTKEAIEDSKLDDSDLNQAILCVGTSIGGVNTTVYEVDNAAKTTVKSMGIRTVIKMLPNMIAANLSIKFDIEGSAFTYCEACASSSVSLGEAFEKIKNNKTDIAVVVGAEACLNDNAVESFRKLGVLSGNQDVDNASIPFMKERSGFVMSEGASTLILESLDHALERGAVIYGEIKGYGNTSDAYSLVAPDSDGMEGAMREALDEANLSPNDIFYINAHGTATKANDSSEAKAISNIFGAENTKVSSTKALFGHMLGGAGAIEALLCMNMLKNKVLIQQYGMLGNTIDTDANFNKMLLRSNLSYSDQTEEKYFLSNSFAFGGVNSTLIFSEFKA